MKLINNNNNYSGVVVKITKLVKLDNCDNVQHAIVMGNKVIVSIDTSINDIGIFFPVESQLSDIYCKFNNLYKKKELNEEQDNVGYFEENRRIKCIKFRGHNSEGLFMPISSMDALGIDSENFNIGDEFTDVNNINICKKYIIPRQQSSGKNRQQQPKKTRKSKIIDNQFKFHHDTKQLYKNTHRIQPSDIVSITYKVHGTSGISSKVLCKKRLTWFEKALSFLGVNIIKVHYDNIYASRKVIKNPDLNPNATHYYSENIWELANNRIKDVIQNGMTIYYEIIGYIPDGAIIQKGFDYGFDNNFGIQVYRITNTDSEGNVFEYSARQVQDWSKSRGLNPIIELFYGRAEELFSDNRLTIHNWQEGFLNEVKKRYNEKDCFLCANKVPEEGAVVRVEGEYFEAYKCKSNAFYELETKILTEGIVDIEENIDENE